MKAKEISAKNIGQILEFKNWRGEVVTMVVHNFAVDSKEIMIYDDCELEVIFDYDEEVELSDPPKKVTVTLDLKELREIRRWYGWVDSDSPVAPDSALYNKLELGEVEN